LPSQNYTTQFEGNYFLHPSDLHHSRSLRKNYQNKRRLKIMSKSWKYWY